MQIYWHWDLLTCLLAWLWIRLNAFGELLGFGVCVLSQEAELQLEIRSLHSWLGMANASDCKSVGQLSSAGVSWRFTEIRADTDLIRFLPEIYQKG